MSPRLRRTKPDEEHLRRALAKQHGLSGEGVRVELGPEVPGILVFSAYDPQKARSRITGTFDGSIHTDFDDNTSRVLNALGFGRRDDTPAEVVAGAIGMLEGDPGSPFLTEFALEQNGDDQMTLPKATTVDGMTAVEYWNVSARLGPWRSLVVAHPDGGFEVRRQSPGLG